MSEKVLPLPLNGEEIIEAVVSKLRALMRRDCFLNSTAAYDYFTAKIDVSVELHDCGRKPTSKFHIEDTKGLRVEHEKNETITASDTVEQAPPNQVRLDTDQPIPVLASTPDGKQEIKRASYKQAASNRVG